MKLSLAVLVFFAAATSLHAQAPADSIYTTVDSVAYYPGGTRAWIRFLSKNLHYPQEAQDNEIQGTVEVKFIVDKQGYISNAVAISGPAALREESVRIIVLSKRWEPATVKGIAVKAYTRQSLTFRLEVQTIRPPGVRGR